MPSKQHCSKRQPKKCGITDHFNPLKSIIAFATVFLIWVIAWHKLVTNQNKLSNK